MLVTRRQSIQLMRMNRIRYSLAVALWGGLTLGCRSAPELRADLPPQSAFWADLQSLCGKAFSGRLTQGSPADSLFRSAELTMHVRSCTPTEIRIPFHAGADRSRTWVLSRTAAGIRLKHDHRHADGSADAITQYGGDTREAGSRTRQEFYADAQTVTLIPAARTNVWTVEVDAANARFAYGLRREGTDRRFRVEFDLSRSVAAPPAPWGSER